jgi:hypothetical protein
VINESDDFVYQGSSIVSLCLNNFRYFLADSADAILTWEAY